MAGRWASAGWMILQFFIRRLTGMLLTLWLVSIVAFVVIQLPPGD